MADHYVESCARPFGSILGVFDSFTPVCHACAALRVWSPTASCSTYLFVEVETSGLSYADGSSAVSVADAVHLGVDDVHASMPAEGLSMASPDNVAFVVDPHCDMQGCTVALHSVSE